MERKLNLFALIQYLIGFKKVLLVLFLLILFVNYFYGYRYNLVLADNVIYKNSYYPLVLLWFFIIRSWHFSVIFIFKLALILLLFSVSYQYLDKRIVAEILMTYCLLLIMTVVMMYLKEMIDDKK